MNHSWNQVLSHVLYARPHNHDAKVARGNCFKHNPNVLVCLLIV